MPSIDDETKLHRILIGAQHQFDRYGYRKTTLEDIARAIGVSRTSLYLYFRNKDAIFRAVSQNIHAQALDEATKQLSTDDTIKHRVRMALLARHEPFFTAQTSSPHGKELHDEYSRLCGDIVIASHTSFETDLAKALKRSARLGEIDLKTSGVSSNDAARILNLSTASQKRGATQVIEFRHRVSQLVTICFSGLALRG